MTQEEAIRRAIAKIEEIVIFFEDDGEICYANDAAKKQLEYKEQIFEQNIIDIFPTFFSSRQGIRESIAEDFGRSRELEVYRLNRTCFPVSATFYAYEDGTFSCIAYDITKQQYMEKRVENTQQEAQEAARVKSEFVANVTHELRTPVNGILGNILELKEMEDEPSKKRIISLVERGCADMNAIINNILDFSKLESGKFTIENREFDFRAMMEYVESNHRPKTVEKGIAFRVSIAPDIPNRLIGDELRIVQILNNLLSNACKFTSVGSISVEVVKTAQLANRVELFFLVIDTGIGIRKEDQDKLFQSFSQVDASISRRFGGTGLGLNICMQLINLMEGSIHVESEEGKGSMFSFHIWLEIPEEEFKNQSKTKEDSIYNMAALQSHRPSLSDFVADAHVEAIRTFGTEENYAELNRNMNKLILSVEMDNWEKAETFVNTMRDLTENAPKEIKNAALRVKMAVQKADYEKTTAAFEKLKELL